MYAWSIADDVQFVCPATKWNRYSGPRDTRYTFDVEAAFYRDSGQAFRQLFLGVVGQQNREKLNPKTD